MSAALCTSCGLKFAGDGDFDKHRIGTFSDTRDSRRCLTLDEMRAGLPQRQVRAHGRWSETAPTPWHQNAYGFWSSRDRSLSLPSGRGVGAPAVPEPSVDPEPPRLWEMAV